MMVERVEITENMKDDEELEMLLDEIPHATSLTHHHHHPSHATGHHHHVVDGNDHESIEAQTMNWMVYGMSDDDPSCSYKQNTCISPASAFSLQSDDSFSSLFSNGHSLHDPIPKPHLRLPDSCFGKNLHENLIQEMDLSCNLSRVYVGEDQNKVLFCDHSLGKNQIRATDDYGKPFSTSPGSRSPMGFTGDMSPTMIGFQQNCGLLEMQFPCGQAENLFPLLNFHRSYVRGIRASSLALSNGLYFTRQNGLNLMEQPSMHNVPHLIHPRPNINMDNVSNTRVPHGWLESLAATEDSLIIEGDGLSNVRTERCGGPRGQNKKCSLHEKSLGVCGSGQIARVNWSFSTLAKAQGYISMMAKDQHGCRFLQKMFDEGNTQAIKIIFDEIIGHVVELMINPFGNYLMQKLLDVCNEEQRMQILMAITREPRELIQISFNTHGTRVVQKLIETLKTRQQVKLVISALELGFPALIKDLNSNHVIQRCLQCLSNEDNKFIFEAAAKFCVDIATHQHGCCVLQRCINHSTGEHRERLVAEISANGLLLAQDAFGNYVVQYILELQIPSAVSKLIFQFEGHFVHLATQKFSSHVVEKCLSVLDDNVRAMIVQELLSATHFEQLLQDPHANYVVQTALRVSEGPLHGSLVTAIESHKAISRNSPYSKRIFSHKLLKK